jgi:predicted lipoprotein with Yx(FWY)xxD motif
LSPWPSGRAAKTSSGASATVGVSKSSLGSILVNSSGRTLYLFKADAGATSAMLGRVRHRVAAAAGNRQSDRRHRTDRLQARNDPRSDGNRQVTYNGHPLYLFVKDTKPGQTNGQGVTAFGAAWFALTPSGNQATAPALSSGGGAVSGGGGY